MNNPRAMLSVLMIALFVTASSRAQAVQDQQSPKEMLARSVKFLEEKPFDKEAKKVRSWAVGWVTETDQVSVTVCSLLISGMDKKYKYSGEIFAQYTIAMADFKLANSSKDEAAAQLAGIESALRAYEKMVSEQPKAINNFLNSLLSRRDNGSLANYAAENNCKK